MFIVHFCGGLGNQIFQYAFYRRLEIEYPGADVYADLTDYRHAKIHNGFELNKVFPAKVREANDADIIRIGGRYIYEDRIHDVIHRLRVKFHIKQDDVPSSVFSIIGKELDFALSGLKKIKEDQDVYFDGYWQRHEFFAVAEDWLKNEVKFRYDVRPELENMIAMIESSNSVAVHIRRGDYVGTSFDIAGLDYYEKAISYIRDVLYDKPPKFFFFSDDPDYVRVIFKHVANKIVVDINHGENAYLDMMLMTKCSHNIIAYSSFSYWGAYFNKNKEKIVIAPKAGLIKSIQKLADDNWILL